MQYQTYCQTGWEIKNQQQKSGEQKAVNFILTSADQRIVNIIVMTQ